MSIFKKDKKSDEKENTSLRQNAQIFYGEVRRNFYDCIVPKYQLGLLTEPYTKHPLINYYRDLNSKILSFISDPKKSPLSSKGIMVTSASRGEGKTTIALNLALSLTLKQDITPLLVDLNGGLGGVNEIFSLTENLGLMDYLVTPDISLEQLIVQGPVPQFKILPFGKDNANRFEYLTHEKMHQVLCALEGLFPNTIIIIDGPSLDNCTEVSTILSWIKGYILVVREGYCLQQEVVSKCEKLQSDNVIGAVFNQETKKIIRV